jgi:uncharacterized membrane protein YfcA
MSNQAFATKSQQAAAAVVGALICLVVILAMFSASHHEERPLPFSPGTQASAAGYDGDWGFTAENILGLFVIGLVSGTFGGMLGMGGGVLKMSLLLLCFGFHPGISKFAALLSYFVVAVGASYRYLKLKFVMMHVVKILVPSSIVGIILGAMLGHYLSRDVLTLLLGIFLLFISIVMVHRILSHEQDVMPLPGSSAPEQDHAIKSWHGSPESAPPGWIIALCGFPGGFLSAMLGISGGVVTNPLQQVLARIPIKNAIANTLVKASITVPIACLMIMVMGVQAGHFDFWSPILVTLCIIPGSFIGSQLGPAMTRRMSAVTAHAVFGTVALLMGLQMLFFST